MSHLEQYLSSTQGASLQFSSPPKTKHGGTYLYSRYLRKECRRIGSSRSSLVREFEASLGDVRPCLIKEKKSHNLISQEEHPC